MLPNQPINREFLDQRPGATLVELAQTGADIAKRLRPTSAQPSTPTLTSIILKLKTAKASAWAGLMQ
ncbi:hypothetical protein [Methylotenera sp.]|uniref:hypothetical protein n=1 Tax=Methylotenera sp. TaxID=2051956 RepID=UPI002ED9F41F